MRKGVTREKSKIRKDHTITESSLKALDTIVKNQMCEQAKEVINYDF